MEQALVRQAETISGKFVAPRLRRSGANSQKELKLQGIVEALLNEMLVRGYYGTGTIRVVVHDGTIQAIEQGMERTHR
jgi:hypothetical protein